MTKAELITLVIKALPYAEQMHKLDIDGDSDAIQFSWRGEMFHVSLDLHVRQSEHGMLTRNNLALVFESLLTRTYADVQADAAKQGA